MNKIKNMKIGKLLILTFVTVTILSSIGGIVGFTIMNKLTSNYSYALINYGFSQGDVGRFNAEFAASRSIIRDIINESNAMEMQASSDELDKSNAKINTYYIKIKSTMVNDKEQGYYNAIKDNLVKYKTVSDKVVALAKQNNDSEAHSF